MSRSLLEPFFIDGSAGRIFLLLRAATNAQRCVLFVPPFGEEMNKSRRQFTVTTQALVEKGYAVLLVDLFGTGDSEGEFAEATWEYWKSDVAAAMAWIDESPLVLDALVATRLGCALAAESLQEAGRCVTHTVFWQPVDNGRQHMNQFLRIRAAASMMESGRNETVEDLRQRLQAGEALEIAGYTLSSLLWRTVEVVDLSGSLHPRLGNLALFEVGRLRDGDISPTGKRLVKAAEGRGVAVTAQRFSGDPFWTAAELVINPALAQGTAEYLNADATL